VGEQWKRIWLYGAAFFALVLPTGVHETLLGLEPEHVDLNRVLLGLLLMTVGIAGLEAFRHFPALIAVEEEGRPSDELQRLSRALSVMQAVVVVLAQLLSVTQFLLLLDGHVRVRACVWVYLAYLFGAALVLAGRWWRTAWGWRYLWWGWAPIVAVGVPVALPTLREAGLVPFRPLYW
jgi:hypothetical protein